MKTYTKLLSAVAAVLLMGISFGEPVPSVRDWEIVYAADAGVELRALELLYGELGDSILREPGVYAFHTLKCTKASDALPAGNAFLIGTRENNPLLAKFFAASDIPAHGFRIRIIAHPAAQDKRLVLIAGAGPKEVLYGVCAFFDDVLIKFVPMDSDGIRERDKAFLKPFPATDFADAPETLVRSVFTWAHPIGDYRDYIRNMARLRVNRLYMWNEYPPVNAKEVVDYAHSWGIEVFWGFAWGWSTNCRDGAALKLSDLRAEILKDWRTRWSKLPGDGIYFQSFTEMRVEKVGSRTVADRVTELVNTTAAEILKERPDLKIVYGLHALSVSRELKTIAKTDPRLEILWEDCGGFPYRYSKFVSPRGDTAMTEDILAMPNPKGLLFKCMLMQDWRTFVHQSGPFVLGMNGKRMQAHDIAVTAPMWSHYEGQWAIHGKKAYDMARLIHQKGGVNVELGIASQLNGPVHWPLVLTFRLFWSTKESYETLLEKAMTSTVLETR